MFILTNGIIAIGPFEHVRQAEEYRLSNVNYLTWQIMEILTPFYPQEQNNV